MYIVGLFSCERGHDKDGMNSTASPLFDNINLISIDELILLYYLSEVLLCQVSECNRVAEDVVSRDKDVLLTCHVRENRSLFEMRLFIYLNILHSCEYK